MKNNEVNNSYKARIELENLDNPIDVSIDSEMYKNILIGFKDILQKYKNGNEEEKKLISESLISGLAHGVNKYKCETEGHDFGFWEETFKDDPTKDTYSATHKWIKVCKRCGYELSSEKLPEEVSDLHLKRYSLNKANIEDY